MNAAKEQALAALLTCPTIREASKKCGIAERTINGYIREDAEFRQAYDENRQAIIREASERITNAFSSAVDTLTEIMNDKENSAATRVSAARTIIDNGMKLVEVTDVLQQLHEIRACIEVTRR